MASPAPLPTLIDTDVGDDVDDAFALVLAARLPQLRLLGVTTVAGPVAERAALARLLLAAAGRADVPVVPGASARSDGRPGVALFSHAPLLVGQPKAVPGHPDAAIELIARCAAQGRLTLISLGPLTNIAAALRADPSLAERAQLIAMGGALGLPYPDWNLRCDPAAARAVLRSGMPVTLVGINVTLGAVLGPARLRRLFASADPAAQALARCVLAWRSRQRHLPILHDALAVAVAAEPGLARLEPRRVRVLPFGFSRAARRGPANAQGVRRG